MNAMAPTSERDRHLFGDGPKRILAIDGGGVRGIVALAFLERIEALLRARAGRPDLTLGAYFDLIGGTSTGAIIATGLAMGHPVAHMIELYLDLCRQGFQAHRWYGGILVPKFRTEPLLEAIRMQVGAETLGSARLTTGLAIVAKRLETDAIWVFHNNPRGPYFAPEDGGRRVTPNRDLPLAHLIRASTAAPTYFEPEILQLGEGIEGSFIDGGVSPHLNPGLLLLLVATVARYGYRWPMGADRLLLTSVGTGSAHPTHPRDVAHLPAGWLAVSALRSLMVESNWFNQALLQWLGFCPTPWEINEEMGDLTTETPTTSPLLHYLRYDVVLERAWLERRIGMVVSVTELDDLTRLDHPELAARLLEIGRRAAEDQICDGQFPAAFDPIPA
jgi:Patatin-like phospholipase